MRRWYLEERDRKEKKREDKKLQEKKVEEAKRFEELKKELKNDAGTVSLHAELISTMRELSSKVAEITSPKRQEAPRKTPTKRKAANSDPEISENEQPLEEYKDKRKSSRPPKKNPKYIPSSDTEEMSDSTNELDDIIAELDRELGTSTGWRKSAQFFANVHKIKINCTNKNVKREDILRALATAQLH